jgi:hypothetical protein
MQRYARLWNKFKDEPFSHEQAVKFLKDKEQVVSVFLSDLKKAGWLEVNLNPKDTRIRLYKLKEPNKAIRDMK